MIEKYYLESDISEIVQNLRNIVARMNVPSPTDSWELAVVEKLITEIKRLVAAEVDRTNRKLTASNELGDKEREAIVIETENRIINDNFFTFFMDLTIN